MVVECIKCADDITEPLCVSCIIKAMKAWLREQDISPSKLRLANLKLNKLLFEIERMEEDAVPGTDPREIWIMCVPCGRNLHLICSSCIVWEAKKIIANQIGSEDCQARFSQIFNSPNYGDRNRRKGGQYEF